MTTDTVDQRPNDLDLDELADEALDRLPPAFYGTTPGWSR